MATALVTGGTSGIGNAFARELAARGDDLVLVARDTERLKSVAKELEASHKIKVETITADLSIRADVLKVAKRLEDPAKPVDLLINNAGFGLHASLLQQDFSIHEKALDVMALAVLILSAAAGRSMVARSKGHIINVSSTSGWITAGNYSAIKSWATVYTEGLSVELKGTGVGATALCPGWVKTEFHERAGIKANKLPNFVWIDVDKLVRECLRDAERGKVISVPGGRWKFATWVARHAPRSIVHAFSGALSASRR